MPLTRVKKQKVLTVRCSGFIYEGKHMFTVRIEKMTQDLSPISFGICGPIFDPKRNIAIGMGKQSCGFGPDGYVRRSGKVVNITKNRGQAKGNRGSKLKQGD